MKHLALLFSTIILSQAALASAPLCRSVLRSFSPEHIVNSLDAFTRLTMEVDENQANGSTNALSKTMRAKQRTTEIELLETLGITRDELRKLVSERSRAIQSKNNKDKTEESVKREAQILRTANPFKLTQHFSKLDLYGLHNYRIIDNGSKLVATGSRTELISLLTGESEPISGAHGTLLGDIVIDVSYNLNTGRELIFRNLATRVTTHVPSLPDAFLVPTTDRKSLAVLRNNFSKPFDYQLHDENGKVLFTGTDPLKGDLKGYELSYATPTKWLIRSPDQSLAVLDVTTHTSQPLDIKGAGIKQVAGTNKVATSHGITLHILDLDTNTVHSKEFASRISVKLANKDSVWLTDEKGLRRVDLNTLEFRDLPIAHGRLEKMELIGNSNLLSLLILSNAELVTGIYHVNDLTVPVLDLFKFYKDQAKDISNTVISDDGNTLVVVGVDKSRPLDETFVDVWSAK